MEGAESCRADTYSRGDRRPAASSATDPGAVPGRGPRSCTGMPSAATCACRSQPGEARTARRSASTSSAIRAASGTSRGSRRSCPSRAGRGTRSRRVAPARVELWQPCLGSARSRARRPAGHRAERAARLQGVLASRSRNYVARAGRCAEQIGSRSATSSLRRRPSKTSKRCSGRCTPASSISTGTPTAPTRRRPTRSASRQRLRSLTLDAAYPLPGTDPAWADLVEAIRIAGSSSPARGRRGARRRTR